MCCCYLWAGGNRHAHRTCYFLQLSEEEKQHLERYFTHDGQSRRLELLNSRRKSKKTYEYEVKWYGLRDSKNTWITREQCAFFASCFSCSSQSCLLQYQHGPPAAQACTACCAFCMAQVSNVLTMH
jgi:Chromo (CHRromatin Organisation MOdifier) domain